MAKRLQKIKMTDLRIEKLALSHTEIINLLDTYEPELKNFLIDDALDNQMKKISATYLWFKRGSNEFVGYITLLTDKLNLDSALKTEMRKQKIKYKELPAIKIGRICVDDKYQKIGIGSLMIKFAMFTASELNERVGCRFMTLDAKRNCDPKKDAIHFYKKKIGFLELLQSEEERKKSTTTPLYRDLTKIFEYS